MGWRLGPFDSRRIDAPAADVGGAGGCAAPGDLAPLPLPRWSAWWSASCWMSTSLVSRAAGTRIRWRSGLRRADRSGGVSWPIAGVIPGH